MQMRSKCDFCKKWQNMFFLFIEAKHNNQLCSYLSKAIFCKNRTLTSFAYCGLAFFTYHGHVFLRKSMKFILTAYLTLRNCSKISVFEFFYFWVISSFLGILTLFLNLLDLFKIILCSLKYQLLFVLYVSVKKKSKMFHFILFFYEK